MSSCTCFECTYINPPSQTLNREVCLSEKAPSLPSSSSSSEPKWPCPACTFLNSYSRTICQICGICTIRVDDDDESNLQEANNRFCAGQQPRNTNKRKNKQDLDMAVVVVSTAGVQLGGQTIDEGTSSTTHNQVKDEFKRFDMVTDYSDHHFRSSKCNNPPKSLHKKVMKELKDLEENLPKSNTIYVRAYEGRIDLLRAVIVGVAGTPYHDALFFFDILLPKDYPNSPPKVHYHSHGLHLNPNLYANGYVCLSLINTWAGKKEEMWNKDSSTILQVLLSIQALVLNEEPYFNEPGRKKSKMKSSSKVSMNYNRETFVGSCRTMTYLMKNPPKNFEEFVVNHFRERGNAILAACKAYMEGSARVGFYGCGKDASNSGIKARVSLKEDLKKDSLSELYPILVDSFKMIGVSLEEVEENAGGSKRKHKETASSEQIDSYAKESLTKGKKKLKN